MAYIIFGAGLYGKRAIDKLGSDNVLCFIDNNDKRHGELYCDKPIIGIDELKKIKEKFQIVVASIYAESMIRQLQDLGLTNYTVFTEEEIHGYYENDELIFNPYDVNEAAKSEQEWSESSRVELARKAVNDEVENLYDRVPLFNHIEIETINRCNGNCSFCPVNHNVDPRKEAVMSRELFNKIVDQLEEIKYSGRFTTFSNNEPLLDDRIIELNRYAREHLPNARMHLCTNGTLLTIDKFISLTEILDELIIDNYQQELKLIKPCKEIVGYCEQHPELKKKVTIVLRKPDEILTSRGGNAPNRKELKDYANDRCALPYRQVIVRPTGQISLCCNDALGKYTLGDLNKDKILDIWYGPQFQMVRKCLYEGREKWGTCRLCDTFLI